MNTPLAMFKPRPNLPLLLDEQEAFYDDKFDGIACAMGGTGSGKSYVGAAKVARLLIESKAPESNTPFWILSQNMDMACGTCWSQNLRQFIPKHMIKDIVWYSAAKGQPRTVVLREDEEGNNFIIEFKSYDQGRQALQGSSIFGAWLDEQASYNIIIEVLGRTRKWHNPGSFIYTLTPLEPDQHLESICENPTYYTDWKIYRLNTRLNTVINPNFVRQIEQNEISELIETRLTGAFGRYEGQVYKEFSPRVHVIKSHLIPKHWTHFRGLDIGFSHSTACVWAARDPDGRYHVYREYLKAKTSVEDHIKEINSGWDDLLCKGQTYGDSAAAQILYEFNIRGLQTVPATKDVKAGIATVQSLLRIDETGMPKLYIHDSCPNLIREIRMYCWDKHRPDDPHKENDDLVDALRYLLHSGRPAAAGNITKHRNCLKDPTAVHFKFWQYYISVCLKLMRPMVSSSRRRKN